MVWEVVRKMVVLQSETVTAHTDCANQTIISGCYTLVGGGQQKAKHTSPMLVNAQER
jgi:hypothetical protein